MNKIEDFLNRLSVSKPKVAIAGDSMVDEYYYVNSNRISPEFPIPVYVSSSKKPFSINPGGASNVACQLKYFNVDTCFFGFADEYSNSLFYKEFKVALPFVEQVPRKIRLYYEDFPLCRWDIETENYGENVEVLEKAHEYLLTKCAKFMPDVIILSDYNKGFWRNPEIIRKWIKSGNVSIVDPKNNLDIWKGCTVFKPNSKEAKSLSGKSEWQDQSKYFVDHLDCKAVLITCEGQGVKGIIDGQLFEYSPSKKVKAKSVIGAGDCFVAFLGAGLACGMDVASAAEAAFLAGSVYVQKKHNQPIKPEEVLAFENHKLKLVDSSFLNDRDFTVSFANGCFDILHEGHLSLLKFAKTCGDKLVVGINSDESISRIKGAGRPVNDLNSRINMLSLMEFVDFIVVFNEDTALNVIKQIKPEVLVKGGDYKLEDIIGREYAQRVEIFPLVEGKSTTNIINKAKGCN